MNVNPNKFDVRVVRKFKKQLNLTDKDVEKELQSLPKETEDNFLYVTGASLDQAEGLTPEATPEA